MHVRAINIRDKELAINKTYLMYQTIACLFSYSDLFHWRTMYSLSSRGSILLNLGLQAENKTWGAYPAINASANKSKSEQQQQGKCAKRRKLFLGCYEESEEEEKEDSFQCQNEYDSGNDTELAEDADVLRKTVEIMTPTKGSRNENGKWGCIDIAVDECKPRENSASNIQTTEELRVLDEHVTYILNRYDNVSVTPVKISNEIQQDNEGNIDFIHHGTVNQVEDIILKGTTSESWQTWETSHVRALQL